MKRYFLRLLYSFILIISMVNWASAQSICACECMKPIMDYLVASNRLYTAESDKVTVSSLVADANAAGYAVSVDGCAILSKNKDKYFYATTTSTSRTVYKAQFGDCGIVLQSTNNSSLNFSKFKGGECDSSGTIIYRNTSLIRKKYMVTKSMVKTFIWDSAFGKTILDTTGPAMRVSYSSVYSKLGSQETYSLFSTDSIWTLPDTAILSYAYLHLYAYPEGYNADYPAANSLWSHNSFKSVGRVGATAPWTYSSPTSEYLYFYEYDQSIASDNPFQDYVFPLKKWLDDRTYYDYYTKLFGFGYALMPDGTDTRIGKDTTSYFASFCSERYPDTSKRPYLDIAYYETRDTSVLARFYIDSCYSCNVLPSNTCYSAITDTSVNPYRYGIAGNFRPNRSFAYYGPRAESEPNIKTNIRFNGTISNFSNFWQLKDGVWKPQDTATSRWVWNSESTLFNEKGAELENRDPLGRYNAGLYGYGNSLATAVANNARYREIAYDGFEDYNFSYGTCISCTPTRNFDFSSYKYNFDTTEQHTGRYSLRVAAGNSAGISATVSADKDTFNLAMNKDANSCKQTGDSLLTSIKVGADVLLPSFSPLAGKQILVSVWAKETSLCNDTTYSGNQVIILMGTSANGTVADTAKPQGNIIEGWQRYEIVVNVPAEATSFTVSLQNTGSNTVYFDDLRIHPYNANMKSFVYDEVSMRLMAELDENNYATFYEYDDDGSLVRVKKETERGIMTIKESRSGLLNE